MGDAFFSFEQIVDKTLELETPLSLLGDTINTKHPDSLTAEFLRHQIDRMESAEQPLWHIEGQHESVVPPWFTAVHDWPQLIHKKHFVIEGGPIFYALSWMPNDELAFALDEIPSNTDILFLHQVVEEFMGAIRQCDVSLTQVPYATKTFIGDFHQHRQIEVLNRDGKRMQVYSPGSMCMRKIDEPPKKGFYVLYDDGSVESVWLKTRVLLKPPLIASDDALGRFVEQVETQIEEAYDTARDDGLPEHLQKPLLWVHYTDVVNDAWTRIVKAVGNRAFLFKRVHTTDDDEKAEKRAARKSRTDRGRVAALDAKIEDKSSFVYIASRRLLEAPEGEWGVELQKLRAERGITSEVSK